MQEPTEVQPANQVVYPTSKTAIASLILGILGLWPFGIFTALPAIICGHLALREIKASQNQIAGAGLAKTGLVLGYIIFAFLVVGTIVALIILPHLAHQVEETFKLQSAQSSH